MYKGVIFDWDGTLIDSLNIWVKAFVKAFSDFNLTVDEKFITTNILGTCDGALKAGLDKKYLEHFMRISSRYVLEDVSKINPYPGAFEMVKKVKDAGLKIGLLTSSHKVLVDTIMESYNIVGLFDCKICFEDIQRHKPHPNGITKALRSMNLLNKDIVYVGDNQVDIQTAKAALVSCAVFYPEGNEKYYDYSKLVMPKENFIFKDYQGLTDLLLKEKL